MQAIPISPYESFITDNYSSHVEMIDMHKKMKRKLYRHELQQSRKTYIWMNFDVGQYFPTPIQGLWTDGLTDIPATDSTNDSERQKGHDDGQTSKQDLKCSAKAGTTKDKSLNDGVNGAYEWWKNVFKCILM